jgi:hypothetical protein
MLERSEQLKRVISEENLTEPLPGLFMFPESELTFGDYDSIAYIVHAYYYRNKNKGRNSNFKNSIDTFVSQETRPTIFALNDVRFNESIPELKQALEWIKSMNVVKRSIMYFTVPEDSQPIERWYQIIPGIEKAFSPKRIDIAGAQLHYTQRMELAEAGCVNGTIDHLKNNFKVRILPEYCWTDTSYHSGGFDDSEEQTLKAYEEHLEFVKELKSEKF